MKNDSELGIMINMDAIFFVQKPMGYTSFDVVAKIKRQCHEKKVGHSGTLDPNATGFMIVLLGKYTKYLPYIYDGQKHYIATFSLGKRYDTQDIWGNLIAEKPYQSYENDILEKTAQRFMGDQHQIPPMYSAIKKAGKKLYEYARAGQTVEVEPRLITINQLVVKREAENSYLMDAIVSKGTYIRTLIQDFGESLGEYATMTSLQRIAIGPFTLQQSLPLEQIDEHTPSIDPLLVIDEKYTRMKVADPTRYMHGLRTSLPDQPDQLLIVHQNHPIAIYERKADGQHHCIRGLF